nr:E-beta-farnesene synthase [Tanacetum cinerariifolium]
MANVNVPSGQTLIMAPPVCANDQVLPHIRWVPIGKSNCHLDLEKSQSNLIYKIAVDLLKNTNFFRVFIASSTIPSIYIQQFWDMILYDKKAGCYKCQLDEQWFDLTKETLREALQITPRKHRFHPRPDSSLHLSNEEPVLGYLKFSAKGTKSKVFRMPIPDSLIIAKIQQATYYQEYLGKVTYHRKYLAGEIGGVQNLPAPKPTQPARKPKAPTRPSISIPVASTQPAPTSAPAKSQENKRKQATKTTNKPAKAKRIKHSISRKTRQPRSSPKSVGASEAEEVTAEEPYVVNEDADYQKAVEESMKDAYALPKGPLPPVVAHDLLSLQNHQKTSPAYQYIFQRRVSEPTGSFEHDESPYALLGQSDNEEESEKGTGSDAGAQAEGQAGLNPDETSEGQAGLNPDETSEGQAGSNPDETSKGQVGPEPGVTEAKVQSILSHVVHAGSDRKHMDLDVTDVSPQPSTEQLDEGFTATVYPNVQENLKLAIEEPVLLKEPASSSGTLSSLQHLIRDFSFGDQLFCDKHLDADKNAETKVESMESQQLEATITDTTTTTTTALPPPQDPQQSTTEAMMVKRIGELEHFLADLIQVNKNMEERLDKHGARLYTLEQLDIPQQVSIAISEVVTDAVDWATQAPLRNHFKDLPEADMKENLHQHMNSRKTWLKHARKKKSRESPKTPPGSPSHQIPPPPLLVGPSGASGAPRPSKSAQMLPPPPPPSSINQESLSKGSVAPSPSKIAASAEYQASMMTDIRLRPSISLSPTDLEIDEDMAPDEQVQSSDDEDIGSAHIPMVNLRQGWWKPFEEERPTTSKPVWSIHSSDVLVLTNNWASALASNYLPPPEDSLLAQTADIATFIDWFCKRRGITELKPQDLEGPTYEIVKVFHSDMKAAYYPDAGLEQMVPDQFWIEEECKYDIAVMYGHLNHLPPKDKKILTTAINQWTRQMVIRQRVEDFQLGIESYQTQVNLTKPQWMATCFEYKHDYTIIESPRAVIFRDKYGVQMMMCINEIHKFSDGTLQQIDEALDYRVKEFRINKIANNSEPNHSWGSNATDDPSSSSLINNRLSKLISGT